MKIALSLLCVLAVAFDAPAQGAKKFTSLADLQGSFDDATEAAMNKLTRERLAALEAYVADKDAKTRPDFAEATTAAGHLRVVVASKSETNPAKLAEIHGKFMKEVVNTAIEQAVDATRATAERLNELDDLESVKKAWAALDEKFGEDPQVGPQVKKFVAREVAQIDGMVAMIGTDPKAFSVKDLEGKDLSLEALKGKVVLIDFWATWCGPCVQELPNVIAAYKKYHSKGFEIVGISLDDKDKAVLDKFLASHPDMKWAQFYDGKKWQNEVGQLYGVQSIPATYLIDQNGKIYRTGLRGKALDRAIEKLLAKSAKKG